METVYPIGDSYYTEAMQDFASDLVMLGRYDEAASTYQNTLEVQRNGSANATAIANT